MPDIHQIITLGIGTPSDIPHFILFGLSPNPSFIPPPDFVKLVVLEGSGRTFIDCDGQVSQILNLDGEVIG